MPDLKITIHNEQKKLIDLIGIEVLSKQVWTTEAKKDAEITIVLVDDEKLTDINIRYLNKDYKTDVIAFPLSEEEDDVFEGEIYISIDRIIENAALYNVQQEDELKRIVVHALLHFLGYSDKEDSLKSRMTARENFYLEKFI